uniref:Inner membrane protein YgaP-like transmembrane domain-containing protein n=1 Tax=uncultured Thiotrichaceae bacterium TaxID=298394 RepID=A0A6S6UDW4_9GAMM|nr:MAG: Unknown protein [uncultured Thiotrichaceae bacterium]
MNFQRNVGRKDKNIRIAVGIALVVIGFLSSKWLILIGLIALATGVFSFCGLYQLLGMNTATTAEQVAASDDLAERAGENIEDFKQEATETAQELKEEAIETAQELKEDAEELIEDAKEKIDEVTDSIKKK